MTGAIATIHTDNYKPMSDITWEKNRKIYAERRGYDPIAKTDNFNGVNLGFAKIQLLLDILNQGKHEFVHWSGCDTMITNFTIPVESLLYDGYHVTIATDFNGIQSDSIVIRNSMEGRAWLKMIWDKMPEYLNHPFLEQGVMMETYNQYNHIVKVVPQRFLNSYFYELYIPNKGAKNNQDKMGFSGQWQIGDFLLHAPDQPMHIRLDLFNKVLPYVIGI